MEEAEFNLYCFYKENRNTELCLTSAGFRNLLLERGRKVYSRKKVKTRLCISYAESELTLATIEKKDADARLFGFRVGPARQIPFQVLSSGRFFHLFQEREARISAYLSTYKGELCVVVFDALGELELSLLFSIARHYFQVDLLFVPEIILGKIDDRCFLALPCPNGLPLLV